MKPLYVIYFLIAYIFLSDKTITYVIMFGGFSDVQFGGELMKVHYPELTVMHGVEHYVSFFPIIFTNSNSKPDD